ncbi:MAG: DNA translocase FtsK 4TM domain-containing protein, partial [Acidaminococcaceae bacterium]
MALFMFLTLYGLNMGSLGVFTVKFLKYFLGKAAIILPAFMFYLGINYAVRHKGIGFDQVFFSFGLIGLCLLGLLHHFYTPLGEEVLAERLPEGAGLVGGFILLFLRRLAGVPGAIIILSAGIVCALLLSGKFSIKDSVDLTENGVKSAADSINQVKEQIKEKRTFYDQEKFSDFVKKTQDVEAMESPVKEKKMSLELKEADVGLFKTDIVANANGYKYPPMSLLQPLPRVRQSILSEETQEQSRILERTLNDFNVRAKVVNITCGPSVTRFELEPAPGVKVSRIVNLSDDLALKLAAPGIRIEPIPGKTAIGIEVPNLKNETVAFRSIIDCDAIKKVKNKLCVGLGKDISGNIVMADLGKMPHLLVAGSTGSGKSVCINTIIASLLFRAAPEEVRLILVDPKVVELTNYNGIPHLLTPVVTNAKQAASALHWAVVEMERRYSLFAETQVREINRYNEVIDEKLPFIIIVIDELADLMMVAAVDVEDAILRLAQKARAAGIHLILATQRPSVDVITGIIKANIPSRIAFAVSSQTDSRTILDMGGAEKLLGKGDMLFYPIGENRPQRVQGAFVSDEELERLVNYIKSQAIPVDYSEAVTTQELESDTKKSQNNTNNDGMIEDELFEDAVHLVMDTRQASSSMLQRKFRIGYTRAARLVDTMEEYGIVGPAMGSKPRELIMNQ